jgi:predicted acylesterase/phospholipase RssA
VTLIQCSKGAPPPRNPRVALVLAGGAVSGGAFKVGALKAFDECLVGRRVTDFDTYVGLSAGSLLAAALAGGIEPDEMIRVLDGSSQQLERLRPLDFYRPNAREMLVRAGRFWLELGTYLPGLLIDLVRVLPELPMRLREPVRQLVHEPSQQHLERLLGALAGELAPRRAPPSVWALTPSGLFDNEPLGQWLARQMGRVGVPDDFGALYRERGRKLFISATELDTARAVVFGPTNDRGLTISQAVQASSALPGFIRPARFDGIDYVDGGVRHTADIEVAVDDGADLIICLNALRPLLNHTDLGRRAIADRGLGAVVSQTVRALLHTRLELGVLASLGSREFRGDIVVIEAGEEDAHFFDLNPLVFWRRREAIHHGLESVRASLAARAAELGPVLARYGLELDPGRGAGLNVA